MPSRRPRVLLLLHNFYPEYASTGQLMTDLALHLQQSGCDITVLTGVPSYTGHEDSSKYRQLYNVEIWNNIKIVRIWALKVDKRNIAGRVGSFLLFSALSMLRLLTEPFDICFALSQPPILSGVMGALVKLLRRRGFIYNIQDLNPEQSLAVGVTKAGLLTSMLRAIDTWSCRSADAVVPVATDIRHRLITERGLPAEKLHVITNWTSEAEMTIGPREEMRLNEVRRQLNPAGDFLVMYSGNVGLYYGIEDILYLAERLRNVPALRFVIIGEGARKPYLQEEARKRQLTNISFHGYFPREDLKYTLRMGDLHWVPLMEGMQGISSPSKLFGIMAAGRPVLASVPHETHSAQIIREASCGFLVPPRDVDSMVRVIGEAINARDELEAMGVRARTYLEQHLSQDRSLTAYARLVAEVLAARGVAFQPLHGGGTPLS